MSHAILAFLLPVASLVAGCGSAQAIPARTDVSLATLPVATNAGTTARPKFLGAFFRAEGSPPFGVFEPQSFGVQPKPYPTAGPTLLGPTGYCNETAANGASIAGSYIVDPTKLSDTTNLGVKWTRLTASQFFDDVSHVFGAGTFRFADLDAAQCASFVVSGIRPIVGLEAGPVQYNSLSGQFSPQSVATYKTAQDFGQWCGAVAAHEKAVFGVSQFSSPGNEVNTNPGLFPGGDAQIAAYSEACYSAIKGANAQAFVYGFELNMDGGVNAPAFVRRLVAIGCKVGTCYDGIAMHLSLRYPLDKPGTPCYPNPGGDYSVQCVTDIEAAAQAAVHVLISETAYPVPAYVPDEQTKALAVVAALAAFSTIPTVDGVNYANVDECALFPTGYFSGACLIDTSGIPLPAYGALQRLALTYFQ